MRSVPAALLTHYESGATTMAWGLKVTRKDGTVYGWTSHDADIVVDGTNYMSGPGMDVASLVTSAGFSVDNTELIILENDIAITREEIIAGIWDGAAFELFRFNWASPQDGRDVLKVGNFGNVQPRRGSYTVELRGLRQRLQSTIGAITQPTCRWRLGDSRCGVDLAGSPQFTVTGTLTSVTSQYQIRDSARAEPADWFTGGVITMTSGENDGLSFKVKSHAADGSLVLDLPAVLTLQVGDTYSLVAGCTKRLAEDCVAKFNNAVNFGGEPHLPGIDRITALR